MVSTLLQQMERLFDQRNVRLVETRTLDDGTTEFAYEPQCDEEGICLVRVYKLPDESVRN